MIKFVNITEKEFLSSKRLYKHMPLELALKTIEDKAFWFSDLREWEDPFEKRFLEATYTKGGKNVSFRWKDRVYCTCLSMTDSSEAYWKVYSQNQICVELRINRKELLDELRKLTEFEVYIGKVEYMRTKKIRLPLKMIPFNPPFVGSYFSDEFMARLFMLKRDAFSYEDEMRILLVAKAKSKRKGVSVNYSCPSTEIINQILIDPRVGDHTADFIKKGLKDYYGFDKTKLGNPKVLKSQLLTKQNKVTISLD